MLRTDDHAGILRAKELFQQGRAIEEGSVRKAILESWMRSRRAGVQCSLADKTILPAEQLATRLRENHTLYATAIPLMEQLYDFTAGSGYLAILADREGYVLKTMGDREIMRLAELNGLVEGCNRAEDRLGTNGIGTALATGKPVQVFAGEHYYTLHTNWVCSGAPIFDHDDSLVGAFCLTGLSEKVSFHTLGMAAAAAAAISQQIKMLRVNEDLKRVAERTRIIVETIPSGVFLLNRRMEVVQSNMLASSLLDLPLESIVGKPLQEVLDNHDFVPENASGLDGKNITVERDGKTLHLTCSLNQSSPDEYLLTFVRTESLHKQVNRIIGSDAHFCFSDIVGQSPAMRNAVALARIAAGNASTVLFTGESGTGKELFAQSVHNASSRKNGPFVAINCGGLPKSLIESELFGYAKGSFTGARKEGCAGKFELANGGTIFLDEIGDMPFDVQASLLRFLQNREVVRIGSSRATKVDVRILAATNKDLMRAIEENAFRSDLYYRLNVFAVDIPPLRQRAGDIRPLADYFLRKYAGLSHRPVSGITEEAYLLLERHMWRGNVRELENVIERAVYVAREQAISPKDLQLHGPGRSESSGTPQHPLPAPLPGDTLRRQGNAEVLRIIEDALAASGGNMNKAARRLNISRRTLYRKLDRLGVDPDTLRMRVRFGNAG